jgi:hypothetical protein
VGTSDEPSGAQLETRAKGLVFEDAVLVRHLSLERAVRRSDI